MEKFRSSKKHLQAVFKYSVVSAKSRYTYINKSTAKVASPATSTLSSFPFTAFWIATLGISAVVRIKLHCAETATSLQLLIHRYSHCGQEQQLLEIKKNKYLKKH